MKRAMDQSFSPPDLLPANEDEKGKERARPWELWWCEGVLFLGQFVVRGRGDSGISDHTIGLESARLELTLGAYHDRHSSATLGTSLVGQCIHVCIFPSRVTGFWASGKEAPAAIDGTVLLGE